MKNVFCYGQKNASEYTLKDFLPFFALYPEKLERLSNPLITSFKMKELINQVIDVMDPYLNFGEYLKDRLIKGELKEFVKFIDFSECYTNKHFSILHAPKGAEDIAAFEFNHSTDELNLLLSQVTEIINYQNIKEELLEWLTLDSQYELYLMKGRKLSSSSEEVYNFMNRLIKRNSNNVTDTLYTAKRRYIDKLRKFQSNYPLSQFMNFKKSTKEIIPDIESELDLQFMCSIYSSVSASINPFIHKPIKVKRYHFSMIKFLDLFSKMDLDYNTDSNISLIIYNEYIKERILNEKYIKKLIMFIQSMQENPSNNDLKIIQSLDRHNDELSITLALYQYLDFPLFNLRMGILDFSFNNAKRIYSINPMHSVLLIKFLNAIYSYFLYLLLPLTVGIFKYLFMCHINHITQENISTKYKNKIHLETYIDPLIKENEKELKKIYVNNHNKKDDTKHIWIDDRYNNLIHSLYKLFDSISMENSKNIRFPNLYTPKIENEYQYFIFNNLLPSE